jgi:hypothetical protein
VRAVAAKGAADSPYAPQRRGVRNSSSAYLKIAASSPFLIDIRYPETGKQRAPEVPLSVVSRFE